MLLLLPPSEGKSAPASGDPVDLDELALPELTAPRRRVLSALLAVSGRRDATERLGVGATLATEVARNLHLLEAPAAAAREVYTGVLFSASGLAGLEGAPRDRAARTVLVVSGLWGVVGPEDRIPAYRLSMGTTLPRTGALAPFWRPHLGAALDATSAEHVVVDCRSATYAAAWTPPTSGAGHVTVRVERETDGRRTVVSHWAKQARGALVGHLLTRAGAEPATPGDVLTAALELVGAGPLGHTAPGLMTSELRTAELTAGPRGTHVLTLVTG